MSYCPTAWNALEHDTARRLESMDASNSARPPHDAAHHDMPQPHDRGLLDTGRLLQQRALAMAAASSNTDGRDDAASIDGHVFDRPPDPARDPAREALERTCLTVKRIAFDIGMPRATLEAYRLGTRRMPQAARVRLGTYLAAHAAMLDGLAQALTAPGKVADA